MTKTYKVIWSPDGSLIDLVKAESPSEALRMARFLWRKSPEDIRVELDDFKAAESQRLNND
jgi:hypothetical protein